MIATKNQMAKMLMNKNIMEDLPNTNIQNVTAYNLRDMGEYSIADWFAGKKYTFFQYKYQNQNRPILVAYDEKGDLVFEQQLSYHIHRLYIDEDGYFYGITTSSSSETNYMLTLFTRIEETNEIHRRKSYLLRNENLTHAPDVIKKDDSNYFITSIEDNVGGYRTMLAWQLTIDIKNGNQWKYWQNEFDHEKDTAEIKYSYDFSVENSIIIRFFIAEFSDTTEPSVNTHVEIERANLLLTDDNFNEQGIQKKTKLLLSEVVDSFNFYFNEEEDRMPKNFICMTDNNLFASLGVIKISPYDTPTFSINYWMQEEGTLERVTQILDVETESPYYIPSISWNIRNKIMSIIVPNKEGTDLSGRSKSCKIYTYIIEFEETNNYYDPSIFPFYPRFHLCKMTGDKDYIEYDFGYQDAYGWRTFFNLINIIKIKERWFLTLGILSRIQQTSSSPTINKAMNITYIIDNVWEMKKSDFCNTPELMQVNNSKGLLARMQTQYYEGSTLVSVFNIPNDMENGTISSLIFRDKFDQNFCEHETNIEKNQYENVYINHKVKYKVLNNGIENKKASINACKVLTKADNGMTNLLPYINKYRIISGGGLGYIGTITENDYTIKNNAIKFSIDNPFQDYGTIELLGNSPNEVYFKKEFRNELKITITCTIN